MSQVHPLKNNVVLETLFNVCDEEQLPVLRQVCQQWNKLSRNAFRKTAQVQIGWHRIRVQSDVETFPLMNFADANTIYKLTDKPFQRIKISSSDFNPNDMEEDNNGNLIQINRQDMEIWQRMHEHMRLEVVTHLDLSVVRITVTLFNDLVFNRMINLNTLRNHETGIIQDEQHVGMEGGIVLNHANLKNYSHRLMAIANAALGHVVSLQFLIHFLPSVPGLEHLELQFDYISETHFGNQMQVLIETLVRQESVPCLQSLDILKPAIDPLFVLPANLVDGWKGKFPLRELKIDVGLATPMHRLQIFFGSYSTTLEKLYVFRATPVCEFRRNFEIVGEIREEQKILLPKLEDLSVEDILDSNVLLLAYINAPELKKLTLADPLPALTFGAFTGPHNRMRMIGRMSFCNLQVLDLKRFTPYIGFNQDELELFGRAAPNIKELYLPVGKTGFPVICRTWPKIELLHVYGFNRTRHASPYMAPIDDEAITGIPDQKKREEVDKTSIQPNILDLESMWSFTLEIQYLSGRYEKDGIICSLSDQAVFEGFVKMPKLYKLSIPLQKISENGMKALKDKVVVLNDEKR